MEKLNTENTEKKIEKYEQLEFEELIKSLDVAVDNESGLAIVVIKPDAFAKKDQILKILENSGLHVVKTRTKKLPDSFVIGKMYSEDMPEGIVEETSKHFNSGPSEIILVNGGPDILGKIIKVTGENTDPNKCNEDSIRYIFGEHFMREASDGKPYSRNAVHRAKDEKERKEDLDKFESFM